VHTITGGGDMLCRVVARSNADLQRVLDAIVSAEGVVRSATLISLAAQVPYRILPLVRAAAAAGRHGPPATRGQPPTPRAPATGGQPPTPRAAAPGGQPPTSRADAPGGQPPTSPGPAEGLWW
jgi:hypothetical protein